MTPCIYRLLFRRASYRQSGINVKRDDWVMHVSDGIQRSPDRHVVVTIRPRVLQEAGWRLYVNNSVLVTENATLPLHPSVFPRWAPAKSGDDAAGNQTLPEADTSSISGLSDPDGAPTYFVVVFPTKGNLVLLPPPLPFPRPSDSGPLYPRRLAGEASLPTGDHLPGWSGDSQASSVSDVLVVAQFHASDILQGRLAYKHGPAEVGLKPIYDFVRIWDLNTGQTFSLNFTILPINSQAPSLKSDLPIQVRHTFVPPHGCFVDYFSSLLRSLGQSSMIRA
ncbi:unnamed protein product [Protopolystoma xenopodis]|uniref:Uncharacterized protein n=1 Tax=Protopolystoma xenopodis TaxID=117903 RepID=A0A448XQF5_9PLAT|nr:unnamed protein product [Protopolystoma xenopodis]